MPRRRPRLRLRELGRLRPVGQLATSIGVESVTFEYQLARWEQSAHREIRIQPIERVAGKLRFAGVAGVASLKDADLEIVPKYALRDESWQEDLFGLVAATRSSRVSVSTGVAGSITHRRLPEMLAFSLLSLLKPALRKGPVRRYRERTWTDWALEGDFDLADWALPAMDGIPQHSIELSPRTPENAVIAGALHALAGLVGRFDLREELLISSSRLGEQDASRQAPLPRLPLHFRGYKEALSISQLVLAGTGVSTQEGSQATIGFVVDMITEWERFVDWITRRAASIELQPTTSAELGVQYQLELDLTEDGRKAKPDNVITAASVPALVIDAKYKGSIDKPVTQVGATDLYEAMAFMEAADVSDALLIYPYGKPGKLSQVFDTVTLMRKPKRRVTALRLGITGIATPQGRAETTRALAHVLGDLMPR